MKRYQEITLFFLLLLLPLASFSQCPAILSSSGNCGELTTQYNDPSASGGTNDAIFTFHGTGNLTAALPGGTPIFYEWFRYNPSSNTYDLISGNSATQIGLTDGGYLVRITDIFSTVCEDRAWIWNTDVIADAGTDPAAICIGSSTSLDGSNTPTADDFTYYDPAVFNETSFVDATTDITLELSATHTFVSHLSYYLVGPADCGSPSLLLGGNAGNANCNAGDDVNGITFSTASSNNFDVCIQATPLSGAFGINNGTNLDWTVFYGCNFYGDWSVKVYDCAALEVGTLDDVSLTIQNTNNTTIYNSGPITVPINDNACTPATATSYNLPLPGVAPSPIIANNTSLDGNGITANPAGGYEWASGPAMTGPWTVFENASLTPTVTPTSDTYYQLTVQDATGCLSSDLAFVAVNQLHTVNAGPDQFISETEAAVLSATVTGATSGTWSGGAGSFDDPTSFNTNYNPHPTETGMTVTLTFTTAANACTSAADMVDITINNCTSPPTLNGIANGDHFCEDDAPILISLTITAPAFYNITGDGISLVTDPDGIPSNGDEIYQFDPAAANIAAVNGTDCGINTISISCLGDIGVFIYETPEVASNPVPKLAADCTETGEVIFTLDEMQALLSGGTGIYLMSYTAVDVYGSTYTVNQQPLANITLSAAGTTSPVTVTINDSDIYYSGSVPDPTDPSGLATLDCDGNNCSTSFELHFEYCCPFIAAPILPDTVELCQGDFYSNFQGITASCGDCIDPSTGANTGPSELTWWNTPTAGGQVATGTTFLPTNETSEEGTPFDINTAGTYTYYAQCACMGCLSERNPVAIIVHPLPSANSHELLACESPAGSLDADFILADANPFIDPTGLASVTYHPSRNEAENNVNALSSPYTSTSKTLSARVVEPTTGCVNFEELTLTIKPTPSISVNIKRCEANIADEIQAGSDPLDDVSTADITVTFATAAHAPLTLTVADIDGNNGILNGPLTATLNTGASFYTFTDVQIVSDGIEALLLEAVLDDGLSGSCSASQTFGPYGDCSCLQYACVEDNAFQANRVTGFNGGLGFIQNYALADPSGTILQWDSTALFDLTNLTAGAFYPIYAVNYATADEAAVLSIADINFIYEPTDACLQVAIAAGACHLAIVPQDLAITGPADLCSNVGQITLTDLSGGFDPDAYSLATSNSPNGTFPYSVFVFNEGESFENGDTPILGPADGSDGNMPLVFTPINVAQPTVYTIALEDGTGCTSYEDFVVHPNYDATIQPDPITICLSSDPSNPTPDFDLTTLLAGTTPPIYDRPGRFSGLAGIVNNPDLVTPSNSAHHIPGATLDALLPNSGNASFTLTYTLGLEYVLPPSYAFCPVTTSITVNVSRPDAPIGTPYSHCEETSVPVAEGLLSDCAATTNWYAADAVTLLAQTATGAPFVPLGIDTLPPGLYSYYMECVLSPDCISPKSSVNLTILPKPAKPFITTNSPVCIGNDINLNIQQSYNSATYAWINGAGTIISTSNAVVISSNDANAISPYSVQVTEANCISDFSDPTPVDITPLPIATATNNGPICPGETVQLFAGTVANASYQWTIAGSTTIISTQQNPILSNVLTDTDYELTVISNNCTSDPLAQTSVVLNTLPSANPTANYTLNPDCSPSDLTLMANPSGNAPFTFNWTGPNGFSSVAENPTIPDASTANNGDYTVTVIDVNGCTQSQVTSVSTIEDQVAEPTISSSGPACLSSTATLSIPQYTGSSVTYTWTLPTTNNVSGINTNEITLSPVDANHAGDYSVAIIVDGCTLNSDSYTLSISPQPTVAPTASTTTVCEGETIELFANATGGNTYVWAGPNGFTSSAENPILTAAVVANNGSYTLTTTSSTGCEATGSVNVNTISLSPATPTIISNSPVCATENIVLNILENYSGTTIEYAWSNNAGTIIGTTNSISLAANDPNAISPYRVQVTVDGCVSDYSAPAEIIINPTPIATASNNGPICAGGNVQLSADPVPSASYQWRVQGDPTIISIAQNPTINNVSVNTIYEVTVIAEGCVSDPIASTEVLVNTPPTASPSTPNVTVCEGGNMQLFANATGADNFLWNGPNGFTSFAENPILANVDVDDNGSYVLTVSTSGGCQNLTSLGVTNIVAQPITPYILTNSPLCIDDTIRLNIQQNYTGTTVNYQWTNANGTQIGQGPNVNLSAQDPTAVSPYSVVVTVDECASTISAPAEVIIYDPSITTATNNGPICAGGDVTLYGGTANGANYEWRVQGDPTIISTTQNPTIFNLATSTTYELIAIVNGCTSEPVYTTVEITVPTAPAPTATNTTVCEGEAINFFANQMADEYQWTGPGFSATIANPSIPAALITHTGQYTLVVTNDGCASPVATLDIVVNQTPAAATAVSDSPVCEGTQANLTVTAGQGGATATYQWYNATTNAPFGVATSNSELIIDPVTLADAGSYYVIITENACSSAPSNLVLVAVDNNPGDIADAGTDISSCEGTTVYLDATPAIGEGLWTTTGTATIVTPNSPTSAIENLSPGSHDFTWTLTNGSCIDYSSDLVSIEVTALVPDVAFAGQNQSLCAETSTTLEATTNFSDPAIEGFWTQSADQENLGVVIVDPTDPNTEITGLFVAAGEVSSNYSFTWTLSYDICRDFDADEVLISINQLPNEFADAGEDLTLCDESILLTGNPSVLGTGTWSATNPTITFDTPNNPAAFAENLALGENILIWRFSNGACTDYSTDTLRLFREEPITPADLEVNDDLFAFNFNEDLLDIDLFDNDFINRSDYEVTIVENAQNGTVMEDRDWIFSYRPAQNFLGDDSFVYSICATNSCGTFCDTATVSLIMNIEDDCWVPNIITPNSDDDNQFLIIPCLANYPDHQLTIFNRWGDQVYKAAPYKNDWSGTFNDADLPQGTYFYALILDPSTGQKKGGFFTIHK